MPEKVDAIDMQITGIPTSGTESVSGAQPREARVETDEITSWPAARGSGAAEWWEYSSNEPLFTASHPRWARVRDQIWRMAQTELPVLILGDGAIRPAVVAELMHSLSRRRAWPLARIDCRGLSERALERKLFGYESKPGLLELTDEGTLLLEAITSISWRMQARLLDLLDDRVVYRLDGRSGARVDVRILASAAVEIEHALSAGTLREELYHRLSGLTLQLPALWECRGPAPLPRGTSVAPAWARAD